MAKYEYDEVVFNSTNQALILSSKSDTIPEGYTPIAIQKFSTGNAYIVPITVNVVTGSFYARNDSSSSATAKPEMIVLCMKSWLPVKLQQLYFLMR